MTAAESILGAKTKVYKTKSYSTKSDEGDLHSGSV